MSAAHLMICYSVFSVTRNLWSEDDCHFLYQVYLQLNMDLYFDWIWRNCKSDAETLTQLAITCFVFLCSEFSQSSQPRSACSKELLSSTVIVQRNLANLPCLFSIHARHGFLPQGHWFNAILRHRGNQLQRMFRLAAASDATQWFCFPDYLVASSWFPWKAESLWY